MFPWENRDSPFFPTKGTAMGILAMIIAYGIMMFALDWVIRKAVAAGTRVARETTGNDGSWCRKA